MSYSLLVMDVQLSTGSPSASHCLARGSLCSSMHTFVPLIDKNVISVVKDSALPGSASHKHRANAALPVHSVLSYPWAGTEMWEGGCGDGETRILLQGMNASGKPLLGHGAGGL